MTTDSVPDKRDTEHIECDCVPDLGPSHCHLCSVKAGREMPWTEAHPADSVPAHNEIKAFYTEHYSDASWHVEELNLTVFVPTTSPGDALPLVKEILDGAGLDIRVSTIDMSSLLASARADGAREALNAAADQLHNTHQLIAASDVRSFAALIQPFAVVPLTTEEKK